MKRPQKTIKLTIAQKAALITLRNTDKNLEEAKQAKADAVATFNEMMEQDPVVGLGTDHEHYSFWGGRDEGKKFKVTRVFYQRTYGNENIIKLRGLLYKKDGSVGKLEGSAVIRIKDKIK